MATNYKQILTEGIALPSAIEAKLPSGAPKISTFLTQVTTNLPTAPDFPMAVPDLPAVAIPTLPGESTIIGLNRMRLGAAPTRQESKTVRVLAADTVYREQPNTPPGVGGPGQTTTQIITRRGM